jgi:hypothetical protein
MPEAGGVGGGGAAAQPGQPSQPVKQDDGQSPASYVSRVGEVSKWAVGALAAVGAAAVTKLTLDRLGKGDLDTKFIAWAYVGLVAFALGVVVLVASVVWQTRAARVTLDYLLGYWPVPSQIREMLNANTYLLGGQPDLNSFRDRLNTIATKPRPLSKPDRKEMDWLLKTRDQTILPTARAERARTVNALATVAILAGALLVTLGAATFALATNADVVQRDDRLAQEARDRKEVVTGEFLPKTPSNVLVVVPEERRSELTALVGGDCELGKVNAILLDVGTAPKDAVPAGVDAAVFHVVTERSKTCSVVELWLPPSWVTPRPSEAASSPMATGSGSGRAGATEEPQQTNP